ncbi:helix-turn-helix domain-containing protein [Alkalitalea saponilacus]|uniref:Helix-turn-helix domain-containing protein n=1 Tax=Alkalitalea saponilacus TaxID=889453 RepID=A0A1T5HMZ0_9BACT|nr:helix-turn-helix domain-containing protein [Alkalitalea saponilacus]SKC22058.1 Helix-turn-helix domain-containing protein [Alkalitalea saponilacus]
MSFFIALLLFTKKGKTLPDKTLTVWVFAIGIHLFGLALDSGFNSKSSFNSVFKKHKGLTPSQFLNSKKQV